MVALGFMSLILPGGSWVSAHGGGRVQRGWALKAARLFEADMWNRHGIIPTFRGPGQVTELAQIQRLGGGD